MSAPPPFSVVVPAHNEAALIEAVARSLMDGLPEGVELVFVCNGCDDGSAAILRRAVGDAARVLETSRADKAAALRLGEAAATALPRFYVDGDVLVTGRDLARLARRLASGEADLVSPAIVFDLAGSGIAARGVSQTLARLPHSGRAFHAVLGVSAAGRARWGVFPDVIADDTFIQAMIPPGRCVVDPSARVVVRPPRRFLAWALVRGRWVRGVRQLRRLGVPVPPEPGQRRALLRLLLGRSTAPAAAAYLAARLLGGAVCLWMERVDAGWTRDATSRR